jgi:acyl-CoA reductase-like NAD-dependent aldehyde dehydrogenase
MNATAVDDTLDSGPWCRFCPAKGICTTYAAHGLSVVTEESVAAALAAPTLATPDPAALTRAQRVRVLDAADALRSFLDAVQAQEMHDLMSGAERAGYKLVEGKSNRKWFDNTRAIAALTMTGEPIDMVAPREPISPAVALKKFKGDDKVVAILNKLVVKPPGKPTLAREDDPRPPMTLTATEGLERIDLI